MPKTFARAALLAACALLLPVALAADAPARDAEIAELRAQVDGLRDQVEQLAKAADDILWFQRVGDVAEIDKVTLVGPPNPRGEETYGIKNERHPLKVFTYVFVPRGLDKGRRHPLLVLPHGGVHGDFGTYHVHIVREMMERGYVVIAPEYRGSTGYGREFRRAIDYGGLEIDDCVAARDWAVDSFAFVDPQRVGIIGWSHGGLISLMAVFDHPDKFAVAYAGVPVSDLVARMGYLDDEYRELFSGKHHIGKTANQDVDAYRQRSPVWHVAKLKRPLFVDTSTNDRDVNSVEVEHLVNALKAAGKDFRFKIHKDAPGGHSFARIDTPYARETRREIYEFLAQYLKPQPVRSQPAK